MPHVEYKLIEGDPMNPSDNDLIAELKRLPVDNRPLGYSDPSQGWRVLTGNPVDNLWARVVYRYEIQRLVQPTWNHGDKRTREQKRRDLEWEADALKHGK